MFFRVDSKCLALTLLAFCYKQHLSCPELREAKEDISHPGDAEKQAPLIGTEAVAKHHWDETLSSCFHFASFALLVVGRPNCPMLLTSPGRARSLFALCPVTPRCPRFIIVLCRARLFSLFFSAVVDASC